MAQYPSTVLAETFSLTTSYALTVTDSAGAGRTVQINSAAATRYFRFLACAEGDSTASAATSETTAAEFANHVQRRLNNGVGTLWNVAYDVTGRIKITYLSTGTGAITWDTDGVIRNILGYTTNTGNLATNAVSYATYQPMFCLFSISQANSSNWIREAPNSAYARFPDGTNYGFQDATRIITKNFESRFHPSNSTQQSSLGHWSTPIQPDSASRWTSITTLQPTASNNPTPPFSVWDFFDTAMGHYLGYFSGTLQSRIDGTISPQVYDLVQLDKDAFAENNNESPTTANWSAMSDIKKVRLNLITKSVSL